MEIQEQIKVDGPLHRHPNAYQRKMLFGSQWVMIVGLNAI